MTYMNSTRRSRTGTIQELRLTGNLWRERGPGDDPSIDH